jgi:hypothetical protein
MYVFWFVLAPHDIIYINEICHDQFIVKIVQAYRVSNSDLIAVSMFQFSFDLFSF